MKEYFFNVLIKIFDMVKMSDNPFSRHVIKDLDNQLETRRPIEVIKDEITELKVELIHIKNYLRKLEARESIKDDKDKELEQSYEQVTTKGWW
tara:strand:- start:3282 stop:3560 length:279 start_codon:yes stop_codon:yes gene_type:complete